MLESVYDRWTTVDFFEELLETAFLSRLIDGEVQKLAYLWLEANYSSMH